MIKKPNVKKFFNSARVTLLGFFGLIMFGSFLLSLPISTASGDWAYYPDALFTSVSAVCVTGLVVVNTATHWSIFGQIVILILIQIGGLGVVTIGMLLFMLAGRKIGLQQRSNMQNSVSAPQMGGIVRLTRFIFLGTLISEFAGAVLMSPAFIRDYGWGKGIWMSLFHSVSAFCNAGFDILGIDTPFASLTGYASNPLINLVIMALIILGGLGFVTWYDIKENKLHLKRYRTQSKVILVTTLVLIILPAIYLFFAEFSDMPFGKRLLCSLFQAVTPRTAGFNTADYSAMSDASKTLTIMLMLIGGSPGSTAGGMKTTTAAILFMTALSVFRRREDTTLFGRRMAKNVVRQAFTVLMLYIVMFVLGGMLISAIDHVPILDCMFESASAVGTVGLTTGITPSLSIGSQVILMLLMFFGRTGGLTLIFATISGVRYDSKLPEDKITVG